MSYLLRPLLYVAKLAKEMVELTCAIVSFPFMFEGFKRKLNADDGLEELKELTDIVILVQNEKLFEFYPKLPHYKAFSISHEIMMKPIVLIPKIAMEFNMGSLGYNAIENILKGGGLATIGLGKSDSLNRVEEAVNEALSFLFGDIEISDIKGVLVIVQGGEDMTLLEAEKAVELINEKTNSNAQLVWGTIINPALGSSMEIMVVLIGVSLNLKNK